MNRYRCKNISKNSRYYELGERWERMDKCWAMVTWLHLK